MCCLINVHAYKCIALRVPIFIRGSPKSCENGGPGVPKYYQNRDPGPHFSMKMRTQGPQFGGPYSYMTPASRNARRFRADRSIDIMRL